MEFLINRNIISHQLKMGNFREKAETTKHTKTGNFEKINFAASSMCGWREYMEDQHIAEASFSKKKLGLFAVFDGHGGSACAVFVERNFRQELLNNKNFQKGKYQAALKQTFLKMDELLKTEKGREQLYKIQDEELQKQNASKQYDAFESGCTANVVLITPTYIYCANSGDSRAVASIKKKTVALSQDHKPEDPKEIYRITKAGGTVQNGRVNGNLNLSRAIGDLQYKLGKFPPEEQIITANPDIRKFENKDFEFIIMGCDGIWEEKKNEEMTEWVRERLANKKKNAEIIEELMDEMVSKDGKTQFGMDNMSSILITFNKK